MTHRATTHSTQPIFVGQHRHPPKSLLCSRVSTHDHAVLLLYTSGNAVVEQRSRWSVKAGEVMLIPAGEAHRMLEADDASILCLGVRPSLFASTGGAEILEPFARVRAGGAAVISLSSERQQFLGGLLRELQQELSLTAPNPAMQHSLLTLIAGTISRASLPNNPEKPPHLASEALQFIEKNCLQPISLRDVAEAVHRSPAYLTTLLKRETGKSAQEWIIAGRLQEARRRLETSDEKIDTIAERVGYADATHFIRLFRRAYGVTPASLRRSQTQRPSPEAPPSLG